MACAHVLPGSIFQDPSTRGPDGPRCWSLCSASPVGSHSRQRAGRREQRAVGRGEEAGLREEMAGSCCSTGAGGEQGPPSLRIILAYRKRRRMLEVKWATNPRTGEQPSRELAVGATL